MKPILVGQMRNKRKEIRLKLGKYRRVFGTVKQAVFGILCREGCIWKYNHRKLPLKEQKSRLFKLIKNTL